MNRHIIKIDVVFGHPVVLQPSFIYLLWDRAMQCCIFLPNKHKWPIKCCGINLRCCTYKMYRIAKTKDSAIKIRRFDNNSQWILYVPKTLKCTSYVLLN